MGKSLEYMPKHSGQIFLLAIAFPLLVQLVFSLIVGTNKELAENVVFLSVYRICLATVMVAIFLIFNKSQNISNFACGIKNKTNPWIIPLVVVGVLLFAFLSSPFISWIDYFLSLGGIKVDASLGFSLDGFWNILLAVFLLAVLPAVTEELLFRGVVLNGLRSLGRWPCVLLSATAFCLMHTNIPQFPYTFLLGILLGLVMYETRCLWLTISMHFVNNLFVILSMAIFGQQDIKTEAFSTPIWLAILMFLGAILVGFLVWFFTKKIHQKKYKENEMPKQKMDLNSWLWLGAGFVLTIVLTIFHAVS